MCGIVGFNSKNKRSKNEINGILVENQNIEQLVFQMQRLVSDEDLRERFGSEAIKVKDKYSIEKIADEWKLLLEKNL